MTRDITLVALSTADTNKWSTLADRESWGPKPGTVAALNAQDGREARVIRQRQRRLTNAQAERLVARYRESATVYQLADEFGIARHTVSERLKRAEVAMRHRSPSKDVIDEMVRLYGSGLSLANVGKRVETSAGTVQRYLQVRGVRSRDTHGRSR
jgi:DNA-binding CsgD family transcriptional regulator